MTLGCIEGESVRRVAPHALPCSTLNNATPNAFALAIIYYHGKGVNWK